MYLLWQVVLSINSKIVLLLQLFWSICSLAGTEIWSILRQETEIKRYEKSNIHIQSIQRIMLQILFIILIQNCYTIALLDDLLCIQYKSNSSKKKNTLLMLASTSKFKNVNPACIIAAYTCKSVRVDRVNSPICQFWNAQWKHIVTISPVKNMQRACILDSLCTKLALSFCTTSKFQVLDIETISLLLRNLYALIL